LITAISSNGKREANPTAGFAHLAPASGRVAEKAYHHGSATHVAWWFGCRCCCAPVQSIGFDSALFICDSDRDCAHTDLARSLTNIGAHLPALDTGAAVKLSHVPAGDAGVDPESHADARSGERVKRLSAAPGVAYTQPNTSQQALLGSFSHRMLIVPGRWRCCGTGSHARQSWVA
jgi:hypothetical protein